MKFEELGTFEVNDPTLALSFIKRLEIENGWTPGYATKAYAEYLKFVYLCVETEGLTVPSDVVDEVWHLHLTYTDSYWNQLCKKVLGRALHHVPTLGGGSEEEKFRMAYEDTLMRYEEAFGQSAPSDIWKPSEERFQPISNVVKVDLTSSFVLSKKKVINLGVLAGGSLFALGCSDEDRYVMILLSIVIFFIVIFVISSGNRKGKRRGKKKSGWWGGGGSGCGGCGSSCGGGCGGGGCGG